MTLDTLINQLEKLREKHGNLRVMNEYGKLIDEPEYNDDDTERVILISFDESDN